MQILLLDDHFCVRDGIAALLMQAFADLQVFQAATIDEGLALARQTPLNLLVLDVQLPGQDGIAGLQRFKAEFADLCVVMYSGLDDRELVFESLRQGAMGFISKSLSSAAFIDALRDVLAGKIYLPPSVMALSTANNTQPLASSQSVTDPASLGLTAREFEVVCWVAQGKSNKTIAAQLGITEFTVRNHLRPIFQKLQVQRRTELVVKLFELGVVLGRPPVGKWLIVNTPSRPPPCQGEEICFAAIQSRQC